MEVRSYMSLLKYRLKEVAADFGLSTREIAEAVGKFYEKPKSNTQVLTEEELNAVFDYITRNHQIESIAQVYATAQAKPEEPKAEEPKVAEPKAEEKKRDEKKPEEKKPQQNRQPAPQQPKAPEKPQQPAQPERKRERRVVDTSAVQVNSARFDDRVDDMVSERMHNYQGGKQRIGGGKGKQQQK